MFICSFSGYVAELKKKDRTDKNVLMTLHNHPRVSTFDMSENRWLCKIINDMKHREFIIEVKEPYPWHQYKLTNKGIAFLNEQ